MALYQRKNSPHWWANVSVPGRPRLRVSTGETDRRKALLVEEQLRAQLWSQPPQVADGPQLSDAVMLWCKAPNRGEPDILSIRKFLRIYGDRPLAQAAEDRDGIDQALRSFINTPGNYTRYRNRLHAIFRLAVEEELLTEVPALRKWTVGSQAEPQWVPQVKFPDLLRELAPHQRPMVLFAVHTGLRQSNLLGLTWDRVDTIRRLVWVHAQDTKARRTLSIPLNDIALSVVEGQRGLSETHVFVYRGRPIKEIKTSFQKACIRAGLGSETIKPNPRNKSGITRRYVGLRWHDLRHTFASWHAQQGTPPQVIKALGGWSSMAMVERYTHLSPSYVAGFANNISEPK